MTDQATTPVTDLDRTDQLATGLSGALDLIALVKDTATDLGYRRELDGIYDRLRNLHGVVRDDYLTQLARQRARSLWDTSHYTAGHKHEPAGKGEQVRVSGSWPLWVSPVTRSSRRPWTGAVTSPICSAARFPPSHRSPPSTLPTPAGGPSSADPRTPVPAGVRPNR